MSSFGQNPPPPPGAIPPNNAKGFLGALFDFKFEHFITPMIVKFVYVLSTVALGLVWLFFLLAALASGSPALGLVVLLVGPVLFILYLAFIRMTLEFYLAIVRMSEDIHKRP